MEMVIDGELTGLHIELVREVARTLNISSVTFKIYPWKRAVRMLKDGRADAITFLAKTTERESFSYFFDGNVISKSQIGFVTLRENKDNIQFPGDLHSLQGYKIGVCHGFSYSDEFDLADYLDKINRSLNEERLVKDLIAKRFQVAVGDTKVIKYYAKQLGVADQLVYLRPYLFEGLPQYLAFSKAKPLEDLARQFADAMETFKSTPQYYELLKKYGLEADKAK